MYLASDIIYPESVHLKTKTISRYSRMRMINWGTDYRAQKTWIDLDSIMNIDTNCTFNHREEILYDFNIINLIFVFYNNYLIIKINLTMLNNLKSMSFTIREIEENDFDNGFFETLSNLSTIGSINTNEEIKKEIIKEIMANKDYVIIISEDAKSREVIGTATLFIEQKFIHNGGKVGHIEDVATRKGYEGRGIGKEIIKKLITISRERGCYKVILDCDEKVSKFYEKIGFKKRAIMLRFDL